MNENRKSFFGDLSDFDKGLVVKSILSVLEDKRSNYNTAPVELIEEEEGESSHSNFATPCVVFVNQKKSGNDKIIEDIIEEDSSQ